MPGLGLPNLQGVYDTSVGSTPKIELDSTTGVIDIRDASTPIGTDLLSVANNSGINFFAVQDGESSFGLGTQRTNRVVYSSSGGRGGIEHLPDDYTQTALPELTYALQWDSTITTDVVGGGPIGNDTAPAMVGAVGECIFLDSGNLFSTSLLFNQGTTLTLQGVNAGPIYTMVNQPTMRVGSTGGSRTFSQHNALRIQPSWGPNIAGSLTQTSAQLIFFTAFVDATVGSVGVTTMDYMVALTPTLTSGGTIGTLSVLNINNISGPSTIYGINSSMSNGTFIRHIGTAVSTFAGQIHINNGVAISFGSVAANRVHLLRSSAGVLRMIGQGGTNNEGLDWNFDGAANAVTVTSSTGASLQLNTGEVSVGTTTPSGTTDNWFFNITAPSKTITVGGDFANCLNTAGANHTINAALSTFFQWTANAPAGTIGTGSVSVGGVLRVQGNVAVGTTRVGLHILSAPSGGTANYSLWQSATGGIVRIDGRLDINRGIALGGGAAATLGTIGGAGPTAAAQAQWVEIDIGGVPHWIPVWT